MNNTNDRSNKKQDNMQNSAHISDLNNNIQRAWALAFRFDCICVWDI